MPGVAADAADQGGSGVEERRAVRCLILAEALATGLASPRREVALRRFERVRTTLHQALGHVIERGDAGRAIRMVIALRDCWWESGRLDEGRQWAERVLASPQVHADPSTWATMLDLAGALAYGAGDHMAARGYFEQSLARRRELGSPAPIAQSLNHLAGVLRWGLGDAVAARPLLQESLARAREAGNRFLTGAALLGLGTVATDLGDHAAAQARLAEAVAALREEQRVLPIALDDFAALAAARGQPRRALRLSGAAAAQHERLDTYRAANIRAWIDRHLAAARAALPAMDADAAWAEGQAMTLEQAIAYALETDD